MAWTYRAHQKLLRKSEVSLPNGHRTRPYHIRAWKKLKCRGEHVGSRRKPTTSGAAGPFSLLMRFS